MSLFLSNFTVERPRKLLCIWVEWKTSASGFEVKTMGRHRRHEIKLRAVLDFSKETGLNLSIGTANYIFVSRHERETNLATAVSVGGAQIFQIIHPPSALVPRALSSFFPTWRCFSYWNMYVVDNLFPGRPKKSWWITSHETKPRFVFLKPTFVRPKHRLQQTFISSKRVALPMVTWTFLICSVFFRLRQTKFTLSSSTNCLYPN